jgi:hypothetical protein
VGTGTFLMTRGAPNFSTTAARMVVGMLGLAVLVAK